MTLQRTPLQILSHCLRTRSGAAVSADDYAYGLLEALKDEGWVVVSADGVGRNLQSSVSMPALEPVQVAAPGRLRRIWMRRRQIMLGSEAASVAGVVLALLFGYGDKNVHAFGLFLSLAFVAFLIAFAIRNES